jgi:hypothetical protein
MRRLAGLILLILLLEPCASCDNARFQPAVNNTNNQPGNLTLHFLSPASGEISLLAGGRARVEVGVRDTAGRPLAGERLDFRLTGSAGGSTLLSTNARSDPEGLATLTILAGASAAHFEVRIEHPRAIPLLLDVTVSASGLVRFRVAFAYAGELAPETLDGLHTGVLFGGDCAGILPYTASLDRERVLPSWLTLVEYPELPVDLPFAIVARAWDEDGSPRLHGCLDPSPGSLIPGATVELELVLEEYGRQLADAWPLTVPLEDGLFPTRARELFSGWRPLGRCATGLAQATLDCLVSLLEGGDLASCSEGTLTPDSAWVRERRGVQDGQGCRNGLDAEGRQSLEARLHASLVWASLQESLGLFEATLASDDLARARLTGRLQPLEGGTALLVESLQWRARDRWAPQPVEGTPEHALSCAWSGDTCELEPFELALGWQNLFIAFLRAQYLEPAGIPLDGREFTERLFEDACTRAWPASLSDWLAGELGISLSQDTWSRTFELVGLRLPNPARPGSYPDCLATGSLWLPDRDLDFWIDTVIPAIVFTPCVPPCGG